MSSTATTTVAVTGRKPLPSSSSSDTFEVPDIKTIRAAIPEKCFQPSLARSMGYVVRDFVLLGAGFYCGYLMTSNAMLLSLDPYARTALWALYAFTQGLIFTGLWILAHECGHGSFSLHKNVNSVVGYVLHTTVLVPFFSWKYSHSRHHRFANHMEKDTVFVPPREGDIRSSTWGWLRGLDDEHASDIPIVNLILLTFHQLFGWPMYILFNAGAGVKSLVRGQRTTSKRQSHLDPLSDVFLPSEQPFVLLSTLGIAGVFAVLAVVASYIGWWNTVLIYGGPYLWMNHWLVAITFLHHTHPDSTHYEEGAWNYRDGALSTIDRDFGWIGKHLFHGIIEYHVVHHLFPRIPFYYAEEATHAIEPLLGKTYMRTQTNFVADLWKTFVACRYVEKDPKNPGHLKWAKAGAGLR